jgi:hypothetical protein
LGLNSSLQSEIELFDKKVDQQSDLAGDVLAWRPHDEDTDVRQSEACHDGHKLACLDIRSRDHLAHRNDSQIGRCCLREDIGVVRLEPALRMHREVLIPVAEHPAVGAGRDRRVLEDIAR